MSGLRRFAEFPLLLLGMLLAIAAPAPAAAQQAAGTATVRGQVVDSETDQPLENVFVRIEGTQLGTFTDDLGVYVLRGVPPGPCGCRCD